VATTLSRNLKLRIDSNLTANAKYNLERIDQLGAIYSVDSSETVNIRSAVDVNILPEDASVGGAGTGGNVSVGTSSQALTSLNLYASETNLSGPLGLKDQASSGTRYLRMRYRSDANGSVDTVADRVLSIDTEGADRSLVLGGDFRTSGAAIVLTATGSTAVTLPSSGTLATRAGTETLTGKTISALSNTISDISNSSIASDAAIAYSKLNLSGSLVNADVSSSAAIAYSKLNLTGSILNADVNSSAAIAYSKLNLANSILNSDIGSSAAIAYSKLNLAGSIVNADVSAVAAISRSKIATGTADRVIINNGSGALAEASALATSLGGTGVSGNATFPSSGTVLTADSTITVTNKTLSGASNTFSNIPYSALSLAGTIVNSDVSASAAIAYSKLNLTGNLVNADIASGAAIAGTKVSPDFGNQILRTEDRLRLVGGSYYTDLFAAASGQTANLTFRLPPADGTAGQVMTTDGSGQLDWLTVAGTGTVTSVGLTAPNILSVSGSPVTTSGTLALSLATQAANRVFAGPTNGADATPTFRALVAADIPTGVDAAKLADGSVSNAEFQYLGGVTSDLQTQLDGKQASDSDLTAIAGLSSNGLIVRTGDGTAAVRSLAEGTGINLTNADGVSGNPTIAVDIADFDTDDLAEGVTNQYFTAERVDDRVAALLTEGAGISLTYDDDGGNTLTVASTITQYTDELAQDAVGGILADSSSIDFTYDDDTPSITAVVLPAGVDHDSLQNFSANEHVDHTSVSITTAAESGLSGGGTIASTRTLVVDIHGTTEVTAIATDDETLLWDVSASARKRATVANLAPAIASANSFKADWTTGTSLEVTHNLGSRDLLVQLYDLDSFATLYPDTVVRTTTNTIDLTASEAPSGSGWRVLITRL
jgi:hypothetical protein